MPRFIRSLVIAIALLIEATSTQADVTISSDPTQNMICSSGVCSPTASDGVLNVSDLENLLAAGDVKMTTTGSGVQANNIDVSAELSWSSTSTLSLDAYQSIIVNDPVTISGLSGLSINIRDGGSDGYFRFGVQGYVAFANLSSALTINRATYTLVSDIATLASDITTDSDGTYALANSYDASQDGTYQNSPIQPQFSGVFEGLGNTISNLTIDAVENDTNIGLFSAIATVGHVHNLVMMNGKVTAYYYGIGCLAGYNYGTITGSSVNCEVLTIYGRDGTAPGGLVGFNRGQIERCSASGTVQASETIAGGLVGTALGRSLIDQSFATTYADGYGGGGLVGFAHGGTITNSYSTGGVFGNYSGGLTSKAGEASITDSYATGAVSGEPAGGFIGHMNDSSLSNSYWNKTTSGTRKGIGKGGDHHAWPGLTGLTTKELRSGLPLGFDPTIWAENKSFNNGFPYLIANPPPE